MKEQLLLEPSDDGLTARHVFYVFGFRFLEMRYRMRRQ